MQIALWSLVIVTVAFAVIGVAFTIRHAIRFSRYYNLSELTELAQPHVCRDFIKLPSHEEGIQNFQCRACGATQWIAPRNRVAAR